MTDSQTDHADQGFTRRHAMAGAAALGFGVPLLAACSGEDESPTASDPNTSSSSPSSGGEEPASGALTTTDAIEVGGGAIFADAKVVVTQPTEGDFKGFSSICTHQGCPVSEIVGDQIRCPCHGSAFSIEDGSVVGGPAPKPLSEVALTVEGDQISLA